MIIKSSWWSTLLWFYNFSIYCIETRKFWNITINNDFAISKRWKQKKKRKRKRNKRAAIYTLIIRISWFTNDSSITANVSTVSSNTFPHPHGPEGLVSSPSLLPLLPREMNTPSWRHLIRTCPAQRTTPASLGASAVLCDPGPVRRLIGINEAMRQLPGPNRIERRDSPWVNLRTRVTHVANRSSIEHTFPWNRRCRWRRRRCSKRDFRGHFDLDWSNNRVEQGRGYEFPSFSFSFQLLSYTWYAWIERSNVAAVRSTSENKKEVWIWIL